MADIKELADILGNYQHIIDHAVNNFDKLKQRADSAKIIRFGTESNGLGRLYPEIYRKLVKVSCGRYLKKTPQTEQYTVYEFSGENIPLRIRRHTEERYAETAETYYFFPLDDAYYAVPFMGDSNRFFISVNCFRFVYDADRLVNFCFFGKNRVHMLEIDHSDYPQIYVNDLDYLKTIYDPFKEYQYRQKKYILTANEKGKLSEPIEIG